MKDSEGFEQTSVGFGSIFKILVLEDFFELETHIEIGIMSRRVLLISGTSTGNVTILDNRLGWTGLTDICIVNRLGEHWIRPLVIIMWERICSKIPVENMAFQKVFFRIREQWGSQKSRILKKLPGNQRIRMRSDF